MKKVNWVVLAIVLLGVGLCPAAQLNQKHVSGDAKWVFHFDLEAFQGSEFGQLVMGELIKEHKDQIEALKQLIGSDLTKDIHGVTLYGTTAAQEDAAALFYGSYNKEKLLAVLALNSTYSQEEYKGTTLYHWTDEKHQRQQVGTFADENLIIICQSDKTIQSALDVLNGRQKTLAESDATLKGLSETSNNAIIVASADNLGDLASGNPNAAILQKSSMMATVIAEQGGDLTLKFDLVTETAETATQIEQMILGMKAFMMLAQEEHPQIPEIINRANLTRTDNQLSLEMAYPSKKLFELLKAVDPKDVESLVTEDHTQNP